MRKLLWAVCGLTFAAAADAADSPMYKRLIAEAEAPGAIFVDGGADYGEGGWRFVARPDGSVIMLRSRLGYQRHIQRLSERKLESFDFEHLQKLEARIEKGEPRTKCPSKFPMTDGAVRRNGKTKVFEAHFQTVPGDSCGRDPAWADVLAMWVLVSSAPEEEKVLDYSNVRDTDLTLVPVSK